MDGCTDTNLAPPRRFLQGHNLGRELLHTLTRFHGTKSGGVRATTAMHADVCFGFASFAHCRLSYREGLGTSLEPAGQICWALTRRFVQIL